MSVVMSMEEDWQLSGMRFTSRLKLSSWELKNGNVWVDTTASQVSMVEMNMEMSSLCLDASAVQVFPLLSTSENEWSMEKNDLWKHCTSWRSVRTVANAILPNPMLFSQFSHQSKCIIWAFSHANRIMNHSLLALPIFSQTSFIISPGQNLSPERLTIQGIWRRIRIQHIKVLSGPHY